MAHWQGQHILQDTHAKDLEEAAAHHEFNDKLPREEAERVAYDDYKHEQHIEAAAHHLHGLRAAATQGEREDGQKHSALYTMHMKAAGENPSLPPTPEVTEKIPKRSWTGFKNHPADELLGKGLSKKERDCFENIMKQSLEFNEVHPQQFEAALVQHPNIGSIDPVRDYNGKRTFLSSDGSAGYALKQDGELDHLFSTKPGYGAMAVQHAIANGARHLNAFDGKLPQYYGRFGFQEYRREPNWTPGQPDVVFMKLPEVGKAEIKSTSKPSVAELLNE